MKTGGEHRVGPAAAHSHSRLVQGAGGTTMKHRSSRLGRVMRWGVYGCTLLFCVLTLFGSFTEFGCTLYFVQDGQTYGYPQVDLGVGRSRIVVDYSPNHSIGTFGDIPTPGLHAYWNEYGPFPPVQDSRFVPINFSEGGGSAGQFTRIGISMMYPAVLLLVISILLRLMMGRPVGSTHPCSNCGYALAGLTTTTCPECGTTIAAEQ